MSEFCLPDLGEGLQGAEILEWKVEVGDKVIVDQLILIVETAKAVVEIPSPVEAVIESLSCAAGDTVDVGQVLMEYTERQNENSEKPKSVSVVGKLESANHGAQTELADEILLEDSESLDVSTIKDKAKLNAPPAVALFAEKLGVSASLSSGDYGCVGEGQLLSEYKLKNQSAEKQHSKNLSNQLKGARKVMAQTMSRSHEKIPSVTLFDDANICEWSDSEDITLRSIRAVIHACKKVPILNAWFDEEAMSIQLFNEVHLGVAVNSQEGLFVPVIREAQSLELDKIRSILNKQIASIKNRSIKPQKMLGATISISNFGSLSGRYATPIIVPPQVAIVGIGKIREEPVVKDNQLQIGRIMPLSLSFDHRAASGAEAAEFMQAIIGSLEQRQ